MLVLCSSHHSRSKRKWALLSLGCHSHHLVAVPTTFSIFEPVAHVYTTPIGRKAYGLGHSSICVPLGTTPRLIGVLGAKATVHILT